MEFREVIFSRHSVRAYTPQDVDQEVLLRVLEDANQAPSAGNLQARDFIVIRDPEQKKRIADAALKQDFISQAPVVVVVCANKSRSASKYGRRGSSFYSILDAALASQNLMLSCAEQGLGSCFVGAFNDRRVEKVLELPNAVTPIGIIPIGHPDETPYETDRIPIQRLIHLEKW